MATQRIPEIADASRASMRRAILDMLQHLQSFTVTQLSDVFGKLNARAHGAGLPAERNSLQEIFTRTVLAGAKYGLETLEVPLRKRPASPTVAGTMQFNMQNPNVATFIRQYMFSLITGIGQETRAGIQAIVLRGFLGGQAPAVQARAIAPMIGLTERQVVAVANYRAALESGKFRDALARASRDGRYDRTLLAAMQSKSPLRQEQIDAMVRRYAERSLKYRAEMIARTETLRAANAGLRESWRQAQEQGLLRVGQRQKWLVAHDERTCPVCRPVPGMNPDGVLLGTAFNTPDGRVESPPLHPQCRCSLGLVF